MNAPEIFLSYSSADRKAAVALAKRLEHDGYSVWFDQSGIEAAELWSKEIVRAIEGCKVLLLLLSSSSADSHNVIKEVALASERRKKIIPADLDC